MTDLVHLRVGEVAELELDNPPLNLVTAELTRQLRAALTTLAAEPEVRAVVVAGAGERAFCAGSDVGEFESLRGRSAEGKVLLEKLVYRQLAELPMPTVAAIEGDALGGGLELALCCDLRVAGERARLGAPEVRLGIIPGSGGTQRLPHLIGPARAKELVLVGDLISSAEAERIGLVNRVVPAGQARAQAHELAARIAQRAPLAVQAAKRLIDTDLDAGLAAETDETIALFDSDDLQEGARAFFAKRQPRFEGR